MKPNEIVASLLDTDDNIEIDDDYDRHSSNLSSLLLHIIRQSKYVLTHMKSSSKTYKLYAGGL